MGTSARLGPTAYAGGRICRCRGLVPARRLALTSALLQAIEGDPEPFAVVLVALPDFGQKRCERGNPVQVAVQGAKVDVAFPDLQSLAVHAGGIGHVQMACMAADG